MQSLRRYFVPRKFRRGTRAQLHDMLNTTDLTTSSALKRVNMQTEQKDRESIITLYEWNGRKNWPPRPHSQNVRKLLRPVLRKCENNSTIEFVAYSGKPEGLPAKPNTSYTVALESIHIPSLSAHLLHLE